MKGQISVVNNVLLQANSPLISTKFQPSLTKETLKSEENSMRTPAKKLLTEASISNGGNEVIEICDDECRQNGDDSKEKQQNGDALKEKRQNGDVLEAKSSKDINTRNYYYGSLKKPRLLCPLHSSFSYSSVQTTPEAAPHRFPRGLKLGTEEERRGAEQSKRRFTFALGSPENPLQLDDSPESCGEINERQFAENRTEGCSVSEDLAAEAEAEKITALGDQTLEYGNSTENRAVAGLERSIVVISSDEDEENMEKEATAVPVKKTANPERRIQRRLSARLQGIEKPVYCYGRKSQGKQKGGKAVLKEEVETEPSLVKPPNLSGGLDLVAGKSLEARPQPNLEDSDSSFEKDRMVFRRNKNGAVSEGNNSESDKSGVVLSSTLNAGANGSNARSNDYNTLGVLSISDKTDLLATQNVGSTLSSSSFNNCKTMILHAISDEARVKDTLRIFNAYFLQFVKEEEDRCKRSEDTNGGKGLKKAYLEKGEYRDGVINSEKRQSRRPDLKAISKMAETGAVLFPKKQFGHLPGINVGDHFFSRAEMVVLGFHNHWLSGIDYMGNQYSKMEEYKGYKFPLAVSIVLSGEYEDDVDNSEDIIYTGQGGNNLLGDKRQVRDQKMIRGNLALKNNMEQGVFVRVIRGHHSKNSYSGKVYTYDGLYKVSQYWAEKGLSGFTVFKFRLKRVEGQAVLTTDQVHFIRAQIPKCPSDIRGLVCEDISKGLENFPVPASNIVDDPPVAPAGYKYRKSTMTARNVNVQTSARGCNCKGECIDPGICSCAKLNGIDFPYVQRDGGRLVEAKDVVYECGPACSCGPNCVNRTSQKGLRYRLEVFRTLNKGWGVRSWDFIPAGAPVCEYIGIVTRSDDLDTVRENNFIFEIDCLQTMRGIDGRQRRLGDVSRHDDVQAEKLDGKKVDAQPEFCIDAGTYGNVSRFINHSCDPNLFVQCVLSDHHDIRLARIALFAADNIPPLQELTYDYGYALDSVVGEDGEIKQMPCYCGVIGCRKRLY